jgi:hypothetical protein
MDPGCTHDPHSSNFAPRFIRPSSPPLVTCSVTSDPGPLNRAEWVKFVGVLFNKELEANAFFDKVNASYQATKAKATPAAGEEGGAH